MRPAHLETAVPSIHVRDLSVGMTMAEGAGHGIMDDAAGAYWLMGANEWRTGHCELAAAGDINGRSTTFPFGKPCRPEDRAGPPRRLALAAFAAEPDVFTHEGGDADDRRSSVRPGLCHEQILGADSSLSPRPSSRYASTRRSIRTTQLDHRLKECRARRFGPATSGEVERDVVHS